MTMIKDFLEFHEKYSNCEHFLKRILKLIDSDSILSVESLALIASSDIDLDDIDLEDFFETDVEGLYHYNDIELDDMNPHNVIELYQFKADRYRFIFLPISNNRFLVQNH